MCEFFSKTQTCPSWAKNIPTPKCPYMPKIPKYPYMPKINPRGLPVSSINSEHINIYTLSGQKCFNTFKLCHMVEICMPLKLLS